MEKERQKERQKEIIHVDSKLNVHVIHIHTCTCIQGLLLAIIFAAHEVMMSEHCSGQ